MCLSIWILLEYVRTTKYSIGNSTNFRIWKEDKLCDVWFGTIDGGLFPSVNKIKNLGVHWVQFNVFAIFRFIQKQMGIWRSTTDDDDDNDIANRGSKVM